MQHVALLATLGLLLTACTDEVPPEYLVEYQIGMESMEVVPPASPAESLVVKLTGIIGADTRYSFDHAELVETTGTYEITLFGLRDDDPDHAHLPVLVEWRGREFIKQPPHAATIHVIYHQPDGSTLEEFVDLNTEGSGT